METNLISETMNVQTLRNSELQVCKLHYTHNAGATFACLDWAVTTSSKTERLVSGRPSGYPHSLLCEYSF
jgi:hypothetical protein